MKRDGAELPIKQTIKAYGVDTTELRERQPMLNFRLESGDAWAFPYAYLVSMSLQTTLGVLTINFSSHKVTVEGKNLTNLYNAIMGHVPQFVQITAGHGLGLDQCDVISISVEENKQAD